MLISLEYLKEIYLKLDNEDKEKNNINSFNDFIEYINETILSNLQYDFNIRIENGDDENE